MKTIGKFKKKKFLPSHLPWKNWRLIILVKYRYTIVIKDHWRIHVMSPNWETCTCIYCVQNLSRFIMINRVKVTTHLWTSALYNIIIKLIVIKTTLCTIHSWLKVFKNFQHIFFFPTGKSWWSTLSSTESLHLPCISLFRPDRFSRPGHLKNDFFNERNPNVQCAKNTG